MPRGWILWTLLDKVVENDFNPRATSVHADEDTITAIHIRAKLAQKHKGIFWGPSNSCQKVFLGTLKFTRSPHGVDNTPVGNIRVARQSGGRSVD